MPDFIRREKVLNDRLREVERGVVKCKCGREVLCYAFTNQCECGRYFNMSGQNINPPHMWEEPYEEEEGPPGFRDEDYEMREWENER